MMSLEKVKKQVLFQIYGTIALLTLSIVAIWITSIFITRRYISTPLKRLQASASLIAQGDLETFVDKSGADEIGNGKESRFESYCPQASRKWQRG